MVSFKASVILLVAVAIPGSIIVKLNVRSCLDAWLCSQLRGTNERAEAATESTKAEPEEKSRVPQDLASFIHDDPQVQQLDKEQPVKNLPGEDSFAAVCVRLDAGGFVLRMELGDHANKLVREDKAVSPGSNGLNSVCQREKNEEPMTKVPNKDEPAVRVPTTAARPEPVAPEPAILQAPNTEEPADKVPNVSRQTGGEKRVETTRQLSDGIEVQTPDGSMESFEVMGSDSINILKSRIEQRLAVPLDEQTLTFGDEILSDGSKTFADLNILTGGQTSDDTLPLVLSINEERTKKDPGAFGDPHFVMWNGRHFDFHGGCDLVLLDLPTFNNGQGLKIHLRTKMLRWWSFVESVAVQIGDDRLEVKGGFEERAYWVNGQRGGMLLKEGMMPFTLGGFPVRFRVLKNHISFQFKIMLDQKQTITLRTRKDFIWVDVSHPQKETFGTSRGIMGSFETDEMLARDGVTVLEDVNTFGLEWQAREDEPMLFHSVEGPQYPEQCVLPGAADTQRRLEGSISREAATEACSHVPPSTRSECIFDVMATNDIDMAAGYTED